MENSIPNRGLPPLALEGSEEELRYYLIELQRLWSFQLISPELVSKISDGNFNFGPSSKVGKKFKASEFLRFFVLNLFWKKTKKIKVEKFKFFKSGKVFQGFLNMGQKWKHPLRFAVKQKPNVNNQFLCLLLQFEKRKDWISLQIATLKKSKQINFLFAFDFWSTTNVTKQTLNWKLHNCCYSTTYLLTSQT